MPCDLLFTNKFTHLCITCAANALQHSLTIRCSDSTAFDHSALLFAPETVCVGAAYAGSGSSAGGRQDRVLLGTGGPLGTAMLLPPFGGGGFGLLGSALFGCGGFRSPSASAFGLLGGSSRGTAGASTTCYRVGGVIGFVHYTQYREII